jgi:hypothetical protein
MGDRCFNLNKNLSYGIILRKAERKRRKKNVRITSKSHIKEQVSG